MRARRVCQSVQFGRHEGKGNNSRFRTTLDAAKCGLVRLAARRGCGQPGEPRAQDGVANHSPFLIIILVILISGIERMNLDFRY